MTNELQYGLAAVTFLGVLWWIYTLTFKPLTRRELKPAKRTADRQPWADDKRGSR